MAHLRRPFVGRQADLARLHMALEQARSGQGRVVGIMGEPGMGKTRLLYEFRHSLRGRQVTYAEGHCRSYHNACPYGPVRDIIRYHAQITAQDTPEAQREKVRRSLVALGLDPDAGTPYLLHLLGAPAGSAALASHAFEAVKARTLTLLRQMCRNASQRRPLVLAVENLHWIDLESEEVCAMLVDSLAGAPILLLLTYRPGYQPPWMAKSYATQMMLPPLTPAEGLRIMRTVCGTVSCSDVVVQEILTRAEGNPFFLEELTHTALACGSIVHPPIVVPDTIHDIFLARLDQLPAAPKRLLHMAAVLGRRWPARLLEAIWDGPEALQPLLWEVQQQEFLYEEPVASEPYYAFKHVLMQEVAYHSLRPAHRQALHATILQALAALYAGRLETIAEHLAYHRQRVYPMDRSVLA
jgi:predicted ATPase